jgi:hypothetical protein
MTFFTQVPAGISWKRKRAKKKTARQAVFCFQNGT